jgi:hypothetical protein
VVVSTDTEFFIGLERTGVSGSRKKRERKVQAAVVSKAGHLVPMEAPTASAVAAAKWIDEEMARWSNENKVLRTMWKGLTSTEKEERANAWMKALKPKI